MFVISLILSSFLLISPLATAGNEEDFSFVNKKTWPNVIKQGDNREKTTFWVDPDSLAVSYIDTKLAAKALRLRLREDLRNGIISFDQVKKDFTHQLVKEIIPHWYGTPWSFGGHTSVPNQGEIACGYFISTTLRDMDMKLNRYALAQKSPIDEAKMISCGSDILSVVQETPEKAFEEIDRLTQEGLYFIGFDEGHVGYLLKRDGELLLIHSNYFSPVSVCMEKLEESRVFDRFTSFHLVDISHNEALLKRWLENGSVL
jgi:hypothetical protein